MKLFLYPEHALVLWAAKRVGRPVKWVPDRSEAFITDTQGRDNVTARFRARRGFSLSRACRSTDREYGRLPVEFRAGIPTLGRGHV